MDVSRDHIIDDRPHPQYQGLTNYLPLEGQKLLIADWPRVFETVWKHENGQTHRTYTHFVMPDVRPEIMPDFSTLSRVKRTKLINGATGEYFYKAETIDDNDLTRGRF